MLVLLAQARSYLGRKEMNLGIVERIVRSTDADLVVFPEMFLTGYTILDDVCRQAEPLDGPSVTHLADLCAAEGRGLILGMPEADPERRGILYNSAILLKPDGSVSAYRKNWPVNFGPFQEKLYFSAGHDLTLMSHAGVRFGIIICYDLFFPELCRHYAVNGADAVICISASPSTTRRSFESVLPARAIENTVYILYTNLVGTEKSLVFWGGAQAYDPQGNLLIRAPYYEVTTVEVEIDPSLVRTSRPLRPTIRDIASARPL